MSVPSSHPSWAKLPGRVTIPIPPAVATTKFNMEVVVIDEIIWPGGRSSPELTISTDDVEANSEGSEDDDLEKEMRVELLRSAPTRSGSNITLVRLITPDER
mmetsp:Transcript_11939/g.29218  ORF Transcript_11939/g.29218 Transcript_11939/m.29218 type:complete len:102 (+) Transcript_11939:1367-1672(+)